MLKIYSFEWLITDVDQRYFNILSHNFDMLREKGIPSSWAVFESIQYIFNPLFTCCLAEKGVQNINFDLIIRMFVAVRNFTGKSWSHIDEKIVEIVSSFCGTLNNIVTLTKLCCYAFTFISNNHHFYNSPGFCYIIFVLNKKAIVMFPFCSSQ